jgi:hypothetical protein
MVVGPGVVIVGQDRPEHRLDHVVTRQSFSEGAAWCAEGETSIVVKFRLAPVGQDEELAHLEVLGVFVARTRRTEHASSTEADNLGPAIFGRQRRSKRVGSVSVGVRCPSHRDSVRDDSAGA